MRNKKNKKRRNKYLKKNLKEKERVYYDACALDESAGIYKEIIDSRKNRIAFISHLTIGEAYANCLLKGSEEAESFIKLIGDLQGTNERGNPCIVIVGNDCGDNELDMVKNKFPRLSNTDSTHLATAICNNCSVFRTTDNDFDIPEPKLKELREELHLKEFRIVK